MIGATAKPIIPSPGMSPSEYEAAVAAFTHAKGVTRCPTVCVVRTQGSVPAADCAELRRLRSGARNGASRKNCRHLAAARVSRRAVAAQIGTDVIGWRRDKSAKNDSIITAQRPKFFEAVRVRRTAVSI